MYSGGVLYSPRIVYHHEISRVKQGNESPLLMTPQNYASKTLQKKLRKVCDMQLTPWSIGVRNGEKN